VRAIGVIAHKVPHLREVTNAAQDPKEVRRPPIAAHGHRAAHGLIAAQDQKDRVPVIKDHGLIAAHVPKAQVVIVVVGTGDVVVVAEIDRQAEKAHPNHQLREPRLYRLCIDPGERSRRVLRTPCFPGRYACPG
jgi:hypothetical protein